MQVRIRNILIIWNNKTNQSDTIRVWIRYCISNISDCIMHIVNLGYVWMPRFVKLLKHIDILLKKRSLKKTILFIWQKKSKLLIQHGKMHSNKYSKTFAIAENSTLGNSMRKWLGLSSSNEIILMKKIWINVCWANKFGMDKAQSVGKTFELLDHLCFRYSNVE